MAPATADVRDSAETLMMSIGHAPLRKQRSPDSLDNEECTGFRGPNQARAARRSGRRLVAPVHPSDLLRIEDDLLLALQLLAHLGDDQVQMAGVGNVVEVVGGDR